MVDFHTHRPAEGYAALVSSDTEHFGRAPLESLEYHPWRVPETFAGVPARFRELAPRAAALGELGLDRLRGAPLAVQRRALDELLVLAEALGKPVVFHAVRASAELAAACRALPGIRKLLHGFRGSPAKLEFWRREGFFVSLAPGALDFEPLAAALRRDGFAGIGLESDDDPAPFPELFRRAAAHCAVGEAELERITVRTFEEFLK